MILHNCTIGKIGGYEMKQKKVQVATFIANDVQIANDFAEYLTDLDEHKFQAWEINVDYFCLFFYAECEGDLDNLPKAIRLLETLFVDDLKLRGIFDLRVYSTEVLGGGVCKSVT